MRWPISTPKDCLETGALANETPADAPILVIKKPEWGLPCQGSGRPRGVRPSSLPGKNDLSGNNAVLGEEIRVPLSRVAFA